MFVLKAIFFVILGVQSINGQCMLMNLLKCAEHLGSGEFSELVKKAWISNEFIYTNGPKTLLLPSRVALREIPESVMEEMHKNKTFLRDVLRYHLVTSKVNCFKEPDNTLVDTKQGAQVRFNRYKPEQVMPLVTMEGARFLNVEAFAFNGAVCVIDKVLYDIPRQSIYEYVSEDRSLTTFLLLASKARDLENFKGSDMTLLIPDNSAFSRLAPGVLQNITNDPELMNNIIANHMANSVQYYKGIEATKSFSTASGKSYPVTRSGDQDFIGSAKVVKWDIPTVNGVIHIIDSLLLGDGYVSVTEEPEEKDNMTT